MSTSVRSISQEWPRYTFSGSPGLRICSSMICANIKHQTILYRTTTVMPAPYYGTLGMRASLELILALAFVTVPATGERHVVDRWSFIYSG
jgi:hypothetical protein